jgi:hypothetical protein
LEDNEGNYIEEPIDKHADIIDKEATHTEKRSRSKTEKLDYVKRVKERIAIINTIQAQNQAILNKEVDDEIDLFFKSMAISVKKLPSRGKQEAKLQILTLISELERKYTETPAQPAQVLFQMPSQKSHNLMSLSSSSSPCFSSSSGTSQSQGFEPYDMSAAYVNNYNYNHN